MKHIRNRLLALVTALTLALSMSVGAFAAVKTSHITLTSPNNKAVFYKGDYIPVEGERIALEKGWESSESVTITNKKTKKVVYKKEFTTNGKAKAFSKAVSTKPGKFKTGTYLVEWSAVIFNSSSDGASAYNDVASLTITLKKLEAPAKVKATAGKKKVTLTYKKAKGATEYIIYRSNKKKGSYKKIGSTLKTKYTDKTAKKGKKYFYKVKSHRVSVGNNPIDTKSGFSKVAGSGKVK